MMILNCSPTVGNSQTTVHANRSPPNVSQSLTTFAVLSIPPPHGQYEDITQGLIKLSIHRIRPSIYTHP